MADRRSVRTQIAIKEAFLTLLATKSIAKITIFEVTELANIGRGTFYLHYQDIYALYEEIEKEMFEQLEQLYDESFPMQERQGVLYFIKQLTNYIQRNRTLFLMMTNPEETLLTPIKFKQFFKAKILQEMLIEKAQGHIPTALEETESLFIASGVIGVIEDWIMRGMEEESTEMSVRLEQLIMKLED
ncbi:TetR-like C-terminal domain-containing protein [Saccharibacillus sp. JS10]|uniref:TetR/AcrR family transcriptional regulator n=1 Tax=Saccharibacillus sp. JS10 TaxID=2950552 RepID=UPI00210E2433|nr:TetR family transcriptional regulator C-terminal domain-containing protein [Saccharibacillus sp. JS10]